MTFDVTFTIRPAELREAAVIADIVKSAYAKWVPVIGREPLPMRTDYSQALLAHDFDVVVEQDRIVGLIETMQRADHLWIENVAVTPADQGRGIGRGLLAHAERKAAYAGCREIRLLTNGAFAANLSLYRQLGYAVDREEPFMNGTAVYMSRKLAP